ncbi:endonuclease/exonuclease/phosphatase family protein [Pseudomonas sp. NPDC090203]|uniref:endonuclease/exonuclease/phosphatase family protein n=1 Tax=Pseudomonas sp. NPDC090203 TaxID=3364477 RepID=UPI003803DACA
MPVDSTIHDYTSMQLLPSLSATDFETQLEVIVTDIFALLPTNPETARHTAAWLVYYLSTHCMRSANDPTQRSYALVLRSTFSRLYNEAGIIAHINAVHPRDSYPLLLSFYHLHHAFIMNGMRAPFGPQTLDYGDALRMLQFAVGAAHGPWHARISLQGGIRDYYHALIRDDGQDALIELGRPPVAGNHPVNVATWNMQGAAEATDTKWRTFVLQLARANAVVALQEVGVVPNSAVHATPIVVLDQFGTAFQIEHYHWNAGTVTRPEWYRIFFIDVQRLRVNLAIVVSLASGLDIVRPVVISDGLPNSESGRFNRPALGLQLRFRSDSQELFSVYSFHAISGGGVNAPRMLREVSWHTPSRFFMTGDFNRDPRQGPPGSTQRRGNWISPPDIAQLALPASETHPSVAPLNMLDYAVVNGTEPSTGRVLPAGPSDHRAVSFRCNFPG